VNIGKSPEGAGTCKTCTTLFREVHCLKSTAAVILSSIYQTKSYHKINRAISVNIVSKKTIFTPD